MKDYKFLPTTREEMDAFGWDYLDIIFIYGDSYIDSPYNGVALLGKLLVEQGFKVGIIAQPDWHELDDVKRLGEPRLFWGVSSGCIDSMVANYTALKKWRKRDDFTPGGINNARPDRAVITYTNLIKMAFKNTVPIILGGIEASLRRISHYDFWSNKVRKSILFDSKADAIVYGMGENACLDIARKLRDGEDYRDTRGICYISKEAPEKYLVLPSHTEILDDKLKFIAAFRTFYKNIDPLNAKGLVQLQDNRYLVQNPPAFHLTQEEFDHLHELDYQNDQHPYYEAKGKAKALETIRFSLNSQRGCYGECNFCAITVHQGRTIQWRSEASLVEEAKKFREHDKWRGIISDVGGATANMYGYECDKKLTKGVCKSKNCVFPTKCSLLEPDHSSQILMLKELREIDGVKKVFVASGLRYDLVLQDKKHGAEYLEELVKHHVSGQLKIAPEHTEDKVLKHLGKPNNGQMMEFCDMFNEFSDKHNKNQYLTYYFIAAHPGCEIEDMASVKQYASEQLKIQPEQVQIFTPTPLTWSSVMYYTEMDQKGEKLFVEKDPRKKQDQKDVLVNKRFFKGKYKPVHHR
ncbi:YgiQ family radical SAM protein, partial [bacterium]|nr:YgiQ family radical SAM protein [bacterium]